MLQGEDLHLKKKTFNDDVALATQMKDKQKKHLSKVTFFNCSEMGPFSSRCLMMKKEMKRRI